MQGWDTALLYEVAGFAGVALYLLSYALLQMGVIRGQGYLYAGMNLAASALVLVSLITNFNLWSAIIQISWICISLFGIARFWLLTRAIRYTEEERILAGTRLAGFPELAARRFLDAGSWRDAPEGEQLASEGVPLGRLIYLASGGARVTSGGRLLAETAPGGLIGELTCLTREPASATVTLSQPSRLFEITSDALEALTARDPMMRHYLEKSLGDETREKLLALSRKVAGSA